MSSLYRRIRVDVMPLKLYGFQKVSQEEMQEITNRMVKPTYNSELYSSGRVCPSPKNILSTHCRKATPGTDGFVVMRQKRARKEVVQRIVQRVRAPTVSVLAANGVVKPSYHQAGSENKPEKPLTKEERAKARYTRPTTASRNRVFCGFCEDPANKDYLDIDFSDDRQVPEEELDNIINRLQTPTMASRMLGGGRAKTPDSTDQQLELCKRRRRSSTSSSVRGDRKSMPLMCGLERTRSAKEISDRLYSTPTQAISTKPNALKERRARLAATQISYSTQC